MGLLTDFLQGASNSAASNISAPIDGIAWLLRKAGIDTGAPVMGSDWMAQKGFTAQPQNRNMGLLGEALGGVVPLLAAAKAPQIANGLLQMGENAIIPQTLNKQAGMALFDTNGLPNRGRELIQGKAEDLAAQLKSMGFNVDVQHSGSAAGPSSYLKVFDPQTGRYFDDVRMSGHSKGVFNSGSVTNVATPEEIKGVIGRALSMREMGAASGFKHAEAISSLDQLASSTRPKSLKAFQEARDAGIDFTRYKAK